MSVSDREIAVLGGNVIVDDSNVGGGEKEGEDGKDVGGGVGVSVPREDDRRKHRGCGCAPPWNLAKVKRVLGASSNRKTSRRRRRRNGKGCVFCFSRPKTPESPADSQVSDPEDPTFAHVMLRDLLEKNDFYSGECNPHLDIPYLSCEHR